VPLYIAPPPMNPVSRILAGILAVVVLVAAFFFGFIVLVLAAGLGVLAWLLLSLRMWWLRRQWARGGSGGHMQDDGWSESDRTHEGEVIDADYEVISRRDED
jgi:hypothetical protein